MPGLPESLETPVPKLFKRGTHRTTSPEDTVARVAPKARQIGITRLGNVTGLDRIGIPVTVAVRPNSRSFSVSQGKGLGVSQAMASAIMEAIELFHGEELAQRTVTLLLLAVSHERVLHVFQGRQHRLVELRQHLLLLRRLRPNLGAQPWILQQPPSHRRPRRPKFTLRRDQIRGFQTFERRHTS